MFKNSIVLLACLFIYGCFDEGTISTTYDSTTSTSCYRLLQYKDISTGSIVGSCQVYEIHDDNSKTQCNTWASQQQLCSLGMPIGNFDWNSFSDVLQGASVPVAEISGDQVRCIIEKEDQACFPYVSSTSSSVPTTTPTNTHTPITVISTFATGVAEAGAASGTQQIGGCEWGFTACECGSTYSLNCY